MSLKTGITTSEGFRGEIKAKGQNVRIDSTPLNLLRKMNAAGFEVSFTSPNNKIVEEVNEGEDTDKGDIIRVPRLSATTHIAFSTDSNYESIKNILETFESHIETDDWGSEIEVYEPKPLLLIDESTGTEYNGTLYNDYGAVYFLYGNFTLTFSEEAVRDDEGLDTDVNEIKATRFVAYEENDTPTIRCIIPDEGDYSKIEFTDGSKETVITGELSLIEDEFSSFNGKYESTFELPGDAELTYENDYFNFQSRWVDASGFSVQDYYGLADGDVLTLETDFKDSPK